MIVTEMHPAVSELVEHGKTQGFITYDDLNALLPDEMVDPDKLDELLVTLDALEVQLIDSVDPRAAAAVARLTSQTKPSAPSPPAPVVDVQPRTDDEPVILDEAEIKKELVQALQEAGSSRIDDPVRMYLTQMGEISLLTRQEEIRLAKKIETCRMIFRRKVLENDYCIQAAVEILEMVNDGNLPFDRTMKISTAEEDAKGKIASRIPQNLKTVHRLLELNLGDWTALEDGKKRTRQAEAYRQRIRSRRRKMATLIEELSMRTSKIQPLLKKLKAIKEKLISLQSQLAD
ncbi:MAG TPA: RNA polymerase sigma factor region1.1 domain-containing protein, partial [Candidatus Methylomirabilis sp.]